MQAEKFVSPDIPSNEGTRLVLSEVGISFVLVLKEGNGRAGN